MLGLDEELGEIAVGKLADLVVFDRDLFKTSGMELLKVRVDLTVYDGKVVFQRKPD
jgi:predicted amidohydrolase YtcJ